MRERINRLRHLGVLFLTIIIFVLGVFIGSGVEELRVSSLVTQLQEQDLEYQKIVTESNYIEFLVAQKETNSSSFSCTNLENAYYSSIENLDNARKNLEGYISTASSNEEEFARLQQHYENTQVNYLMLAQRISSLCDESLNTIIYFYDNDEQCPECEDQGVYLNYVKQQLQEEVMIFSFNVKSQGPVELIRSRYNISIDQTMPKLIVNGNEILNYSSSEEILQELCSSSNLTSYSCIN